MIEQGIVVIIVAAAVGYACWKLMPRVLRVRVAGAFARVAIRRGALSHRRAAQLGRRLAGGDCSVCETCGGCASRASVSGIADDTMAAVGSPPDGRATPR